MRKYSNEVKVGIFFVFCLLGFMYLIVSTGKLHVKEEGYHIYVVFDDIAGMEKNAPVMVNGVEVGRVQDIEVSYDEGSTEVKLKLLIQPDIKIWQDPTVSIKTLGLMGEKYIQIVSPKGAGFIPPGTVLQGKPSMDMDVLLGEAEGLSRDIKSLINNVDSLTDEVKKLAKNLNYTVEDNQDSISRMIKHFEVTSENFEEFSQDVKKNPWKLLFKAKEKK